jgi:hypothetical protein
MITSRQEALVLYSACETERRQLEFALQLAQDDLQRATQKFQYARKGLTKAEFRTGKIRRMIKKSGFSSILQQASRARLRPVIRLHRMLYLFSAILNAAAHNTHSENHVFAVPGAQVPLSVDLD